MKAKGLLNVLEFDVFRVRWKIGKGHTLGIRVGGTRADVTNEGCAETIRHLRPVHQLLHRIGGDVSLVTCRNNLNHIRDNYVLGLAGAAVRQLATHHTGGVSRHHVAV